MQKKVNKLIRELEEKQDEEFDKNGKSDYFLFLEDVIWEVNELADKWEKAND